MRGIDRTTGDPILLEIRPSAAAYMNVLDISGGTSLISMFQRAPWRAIGFCIAGLSIVWLIGWSAVYSSVVLLVTLGLGAIELWHRRDFITSKRLVRQYGLLGRRRLELFLSDIETVEHSYPRYGERFNAGDVDVRGGSKGFSFVGIESPKDVAQAILDARSRVVT